MQRTILVLAVIITGLFGPQLAVAQTSAATETQFRFDLEEAQSPHRGPAVEGYLYNHLPWRITNIRLRVESVDPTGQVTAEASGWVMGDVGGGGRGYFFVPVSSRAATYRATVQSFDKIRLEERHFEAP